MSHEIANHWRLRHHRLRLEGSIRKFQDGSIRVSSNGVNWVEKEGNGYHRSENPFEGVLIYQAPSVEASLLSEIRGEVEINAASD
jgi:hypothetical protein